MAALQDTDVPVPRCLLFCDDPSILGTEFFVMEFVNGRVIEDTSLIGDKYPLRGIHTFQNSPSKWLCSLS